MECGLQPVLLVLVGVEKTYTYFHREWCAYDGLHCFYIKAINCGPLTDPDNEQVDTSNGTTFGRIATYACCRESGSRTCGADGMWTSEEPNCQGKHSNLTCCFL